MKDASETHSSLGDEFDVVHVSPSNRAFQTDTIKPIGLKTSARQGSHVSHRQSRPLPKITCGESGSLTSTDRNLYDGDQRHHSAT